MPSRRPVGKARRSADRPLGNLPQRRRILIVCEGKKTEPYYFSSIITKYELNGARVDEGPPLEVSIVPDQKNTRTLVNYSERRQGEAVSNGDPFDEIWCVFDLDDFPVDDFDNAINKIEAHPVLHSAWSNEAFELWYVLHFAFLDTAPMVKGKVREYYMQRLEDLAPEMKGVEYEKKIADMFNTLGVPRLRTAYRNASKLLAKCDPASPFHKRKPATTVHLLVEALLNNAPEVVAAGGFKAYLEKHARPDA